MNSNFRFRAFSSLRTSSVFLIPYSCSVEGTDAESGTKAISLRRKESGGLPISSVGCTRSKRVTFLFTHPLGRTCEPDIILYRSPHKCFSPGENRMQSIVGTWKLLHATARDAAGAARPLPYGGKALGRVTFTADGA